MVSRNIADKNQVVKQHDDIADLTWTKICLKPFDLDYTTLVTRIKFEKQIDLTVQISLSRLNSIISIRIGENENVIKILEIDT
jgi:hypothetical protein